MAEITLEDVRKVYDPDGEAIVAVDDVNLQIRDGEFVVFVGPSGCGKTTTLRMIAGLESVSGGTITFDDRDVTDVRPRDRNVAMVFQDYALYPHMTVRKNVGFGLRLSTDRSEAEIEQQVEETARMLGIEAQLDKHPPALSGGQQQRVALGRAIVRDPSVFLLDEPLSNLDAKLRDVMRKEIMRLQRDLDVTAVYVTHDQTEAMALGDRVVVLNDGRVQQVGPPEEVYRAPENRFVAGFVGNPSMNFLETTVEDGSGDTIRFDGTGDFSLAVDPADLPDGVQEYDRLVVGVRPEDLTVVDSGGFPAEVGITEAMGDENVVFVHCDDEELTVRTETAVRLEHGSTVRLTVDPDDLYLFDPDTDVSIKTKTHVVDGPRGSQVADTTEAGQ